MFRSCSFGTKYKYCSSCHISQMHLCLLSLGVFSFPTARILTSVDGGVRISFKNLSQTTDSRLLVFLRFIWKLKHCLTLHRCFVFILLFASTVHRKPTKIRAFGCTRYAYLLLLRFILKHTSYVCFRINTNTAHPFPNATIIAFNTSFFRGSALLDLLAIVCNLSSVCLLIGQTATP